MRRVFAFFLVVLFFVFTIFTIESLLCQGPGQVKAVLSLKRIIPVAYAQSSNSSSGIAVYIGILNKSVVEGDIITLSKKGYVLSSVPYDPNLFGVVVRDPAIAFESSQPNSHPVVSEGKVFMRVSTVNGKIKKGDLITSSTIPGVGQKATESGFIVATALEDYSANSSKDIGRILVVLSVGHGTVSTDTRGNLLKSFEFVLKAPYMSPMSVLRYVFAAVMVIVSFLIAVGYFGRISSLGIEALGRNPLAGRIILFSIVLHIILAFTIIAVGIAVAYLTLVM